MRLTFSQFIISQVVILSLGLLFLFGIHYFINIETKSSEVVTIRKPLTSLQKTLTLDLDQPDDDLLTFQSSILISGKTAPEKEVLIFTDTQDLVIKSKGSGSYSTVLDLDEGVNRITTVVFDSTGESKSIERTVYYSKEKI